MIDKVRPAIEDFLEKETSAGFVLFGAAILAMLMFAAATRGFWLTKSRLWETVALLLVTYAPARRR